MPVSNVFLLRQYALPGSLDDDGPLNLRPWMLNFHAQFGLRGYIEPEDTSAFLVSKQRKAALVCSGGCETLRTWRT